MAPAPDEEVHRDEHDLEAEEEDHQVHCAEHADHARLQQQHPGEVGPLVVARVDRQQGNGEEDPGQDDQEEGDAVNGQQPLDAKVRHPGMAKLELHVGPTVDVEGDQ